MKLSIMAKLLTMVVAVVVLSGVSIFLTSHYFMSLGFDDGVALAKPDTLRLLTVG